MKTSYPFLIWITSVVPAALLLSGLQIREDRAVESYYSEFFGVALFGSSIGSVITIPAFIIFYLIAEKLCKGSLSTRTIKFILGTGALLCIFTFRVLSLFEEHSENQYSPTTFFAIYCIVLLKAIAVFQLRKKPEEPQASQEL